MTQAASICSPVTGCTPFVHSTHGSSPWTSFSVQRDNAHTHLAMVNRLDFISAIKPRAGLQQIELPGPAFRVLG